MANKVLSIKIDENDINRIKQYYETLVGIGVVDKDTMKFNGFLKHLLTDNLAIDFKSLMSVYSEFGLEPSCADPRILDGKYGFKMHNVYNFDDETFKLYISCWKEKMEQGIEKLEERTKILASITGLMMRVQSGMNYTIDMIDKGEDRCHEFWRKKAVEQLELNKEESGFNNIQYDIEAIQSSNISEDMKEKIIEQINQYAEAVRKNNEITKGVRNIGIK